MYASVKSLSDDKTEMSKINGIEQGIGALFAIVSPAVAGFILTFISVRIFSWVEIVCESIVILLVFRLNFERFDTKNEEESVSVEKISYKRVLQLLNKKYPDYSFYFIMGADSLITFSHWKNPDIIAANCIILAALRDDVENVQMDNLIKKIKEEFSADIFKIKCNKLDISSKDIRRLIKNNDNVSSMLPDNVLEYIKANKLYN